VTALKAPFPWFGGKSNAATLVWERFGDVPNYVEPFFGSGAMLLGRPSEPRTETVNDLDGLLCNFWRAVAADPDGVAKAADWPVSECDLSARHIELVEKRAGLTERLAADARYFDVEAAGWWVWGQCAWIGTGWCSGEGPWVREGDRLVKGDAGRGISRQLPHLGDAGRGINRTTENIVSTMRVLGERLRRVRVACGSWERVVTDVVTWRYGVTGVFLDPPYAEGKMSYSAGGHGVAVDVAEWAREAGKRPDMRIALCGHEGEHDMPGWACEKWTAKRGYAKNEREGEDNYLPNRHRERIWFSQACLSASQGRLF